MPKGYPLNMSETDRLDRERKRNRERMRAWRASNIELARQRGREWSAGNREYLRHRESKRRATQPEKVRASQRKTLYGITPDEYERMRSGQRDTCAICLVHERRGSRNKNLCVDHDHVTGKVRGLLCSGCNSALGHMNENPAWLMRAIQYLVRHQPIREVS